MNTNCEDPELELQRGIQYFLDFKEDGPNDEENMKKAFDCFIKSANYSAIAKHHLGVCYYYGLGCQVDTKQGVHYNSLSAKEGYCIAVLKSIFRDKEDEWNAKDKDEAIQNCVFMAERQTDAFAICQLGLFRAGNQWDYRIGKTAVEYYREAALLGHVIAQYNLGYRYREGIGVQKNFSEAFKWMKIAADRGYNLAMTALGGLYDFGKGVDKNFEEAVKWYIKATDKNEPMAFHNLGMSYLHGEGVEQDVSKAAEVFHKGSLLGNLEATHNYAKLLLTGNGVDKDEAKAFELFHKSALKEHVWSIYRLGLCYEDGLGTPVNWEEAKKMYIRATDKHLGSAEKALQRIVSKIENWPQMRLVWLGYLKNRVTDSTPFENRCWLAILPKDIIGEILKCVMRHRAGKKA